MNLESHELTIEDVRVLIDTLSYSIDKIRNYPYTDEQQRNASLRPLQQVRYKLRFIRNELKGKQ